MNYSINERQLIDTIIENIKDKDLHDFIKDVILDYFKPNPQGYPFKILSEENIERFELLKDKFFFRSECREDREDYKYYTIDFKYYISLNIGECNMVNLVNKKYCDSVEACGYESMYFQDVLDILNIKDYDKLLDVYIYNSLRIFSSLKVAENLNELTNSENGNKILDEWIERHLRLYNYFKINEDEKLPKFIIKLYKSYCFSLI